jgi:hypothetical protein
LTTLGAAAHGTADQLVALGKVSQPWVLASRARKDAHKTLADNAVAAQTQVVQLDALQGEAAAANDLRKVSAALGQAATIKVRLEDLLANSNAAYSVYSK